MNDSSNVGGLTASAISWIFTATQADEVLAYIQLVLSIVATIVSLIISISVWFRRAKADGKISNEELDELRNTMDDAKTSIENAFENKENKSKEGKENGNN